MIPDYESRACLLDTARSLGAVMALSQTHPKNKMFSHHNNPADMNAARCCVINNQTMADRFSRTIECGSNSLQGPRLCGQSRTTIRARHFAALIGRLWIGGN
jgi:hypothetical protein